MSFCRQLCFALLIVAGSAIAGESPIRITDLADVQEAHGDIAAGQPDEAQVAKLASKGYVALIDLRGEEEDRGFDEVAAARAAGIEYSALPIGDEDAINLENARKLGDLLDSFDGPVVVHCASGNRVGALIALLEADRGASDAENGVRPAPGIKACGWGVR